MMAWTLYRVVRTNRNAMANETLRETETTFRFGMKIVAVNKKNGLYVGNLGFTGSVETARRFPSVAEAKEYCLTNGVNKFSIFAYVPGAVAANSILVAESETTFKEPPNKPRFD
jgi:hypothetical protein